MWNAAVAIALTLEGVAYAQQHQFDSWTTESGLPQNSVNDILQTHDGYLWVATFGGLVRFDGMRFVVFDRSVAGIQSQRVMALHEDRHGTLWAATEDGMLIRHRDGRFHTYTKRDGLPDAMGFRIDDDDDGNLWVTWRGVVTRFDGARFVNFAPSQFASGLTAPPDTNYLDAWWSQDSTGVRVLVRGRVRTYPVRRDWLHGDVTRVVPDRQGNIWMLGNTAGAIKASDDGLEYHPTGDGLPSDRLTFVFEDGRGRVWFIDNEGRFFRVRDGVREWIDVPTAVGTGPSSTRLRSFYVDREGSIWLGTVAAGLRRRRDAFVSLRGEHEGLSLNFAYSILQDRAGAIWVGTWGGGLNRYTDGRFTAFRAAQGLAGDYITCIYEDSAGRLWAAANNQGLFYLHNGRFKRHELGSGSFANVLTMLEDRSGTLWLGTDEGLVRSTRGELTVYRTKDGLSHDHILTLFEDRADVLWIGTMQGLTRLKDGVFTAYGERDGLIGNQVRAIHEDDGGVLWIGTYDGGLYRLANERLTRYTRHDGLYDNGVFQILEDDNGYFWMGSNRGISRVSRRELNEVAEGRRGSVTPVVFGTRDGLTNVEVNGGRQPAGWKASDGKLWFPTMAGAAVIDPAAVQFSKQPPPAVIEEVRLAGMPVDFSGDVTIPPDVSVFDVRYTAPTFIRPEQVRFRYQLIGLDRQWIEAGDRRTASFHGVRPGKYRFVVTASTAEGGWTLDGPGLTLVVLPPFWRTWWFLSLAFTAVAVIALVGHHRRVQRFRAQQVLQEAFSRQLIDSQEGERRRISNEMHDSLGQHLAIIKRHARAGEERANGAESVREAFQEIAAVADGITTDIREIARGLRPYQLDAIGLSKTIEGMVHRVGKACDIEFDATIASIDDAYPPDVHIHIYRIVQESVNNIVKHARASRAVVAVVRRTACVEIRVEDNGVGIDHDSAAGGRPAKQGFGLMGIRERARILGGHAEIRSGARGGTAVVVTLPFHEDAHG